MSVFKTPLMDSKKKKSPQTSEPSQQHFSCKGPWRPPHFSSSIYVLGETVSESGLGSMQLKHGKNNYSSPTCCGINSITPCIFSLEKVSVFPCKWYGTGERASKQTERWEWWGMMEERREKAVSGEKKCTGVQTKCEKCGQVGRRTNSGSNVLAEIDQQTFARTLFSPTHSSFSCRHNTRTAYQRWVTAPESGGRPTACSPLCRRPTSIAGTSKAVRGRLHNSVFAVGLNYLSAVLSNIGMMKCCSHIIFIAFEVSPWGPRGRHGDYLLKFKQRNDFLSFLIEFLWADRRHVQGSGLRQEYNI